MPIQAPIPEVTPALEEMLSGVQAVAFPPKEKTFFSIEGIIGRLENPTTDLLRFFMDPSAGHGLGTVFLSALFNCLGCSHPGFDGVEVSTQLQTCDGKYVDLLAAGVDWVLVIENKIDALEDNPWESYEDHAKAYERSVPYFVILCRYESPNPKPKGWERVTYRDYCGKLKQELEQMPGAVKTSKWHVFARELVIHLENELYDPQKNMNDKQIDFVERNFQHIEEVKALGSSYDDHLRQELNKAVSGRIARDNFPGFHNQGWAFVCDQRFAHEELLLYFGTPVQFSGKRAGGFVIGVWVKGPSADYEQQIIRAFPEHRLYPESGGKNFERCFSDRLQAVEALGELAAKCFALLHGQNP